MCDYDFASLGKLENIGLNIKKNAYCEHSRRSRSHLPKINIREERIRPPPRQKVYLVFSLGDDVS